MYSLLCPSKCWSVWQWLSCTWPVPNPRHGLTVFFCLPNYSWHVITRSNPGDSSQMVALCKHDCVFYQVNSLGKYKALGLRILSVLKIHIETEMLECKRVNFCFLCQFMANFCLGARSRGECARQCPLWGTMENPLKNSGLKECREELYESRNLNPMQFSVYLFWICSCLIRRGARILSWLQSINLVCICLLLRSFAGRQGSFLQLSIAWVIWS